MPQPLDDHVRRRMEQQRRRDTCLELEIRHRLHALGYRYRVDYRPESSLRVRADIVFTRRRVAVFVDGCFWHGCPEHGTAPKNNAQWWRDKIDANIERDHRNRVRLRELGWTVFSVWEHEAAEQAVRRLTSVVGPPGHAAAPAASR